jgi:hypothetical protein
MLNNTMSVHLHVARANDMCMHACCSHLLKCNDLIAVI